ncbi:MAG: phosphotransferase family protein [Sphaerobacter sp.]|nr:phosphotransferase family protein [Sphaerobacter sp.]
MSPEHEPFDRLIRRLDPGSQVLRVWELTGGVSAQVTALEVLLSHGRRQRLVVRRYGAADLVRAPHVAAHEFRLLQIVRSVGVPAPRPYYVDESGDIFPTPVTVIEFVEGQAGLTPTDLGNVIDQTVDALTTIHSVDGSTAVDLSFLPRQEEVCAVELRRRLPPTGASPEATRIRAALDAVWPLPQRNRAVLLHGDFWPGNTLWRDGRLVAVIDWEDAALGDPLADVANARLELLWALGVEAMESFTERYRSRMGAVDFVDLPYWDLAAALRPAVAMSAWGLDAHTARTMRDRLRWFVSEALGRVG